LKIALICPRYFNPEEIWGESLEFMQLQSVLQRMNFTAHLYDITNWQGAITKPYDIVINNCNTYGGIHHAMSICPAVKIFWVVSSPINMQWILTEDYGYDFYLSISESHVNEIRQSGKVAYFVECATDTWTFHPDFMGNYDCNYLYVGNYDDRKISLLMKYFRDKDNIHVYGNGWDAFYHPSITWKGKYIPYEETRRVYTQAMNVFAIHNQDMIERGMIQGRVYDILACGQPKKNIITNQDISRVDIERLDYKYRVNEILDIIDKKEWKR